MKKIVMIIIITLSVYFSMMNPSNTIDDALEVMIYVDSDEHAHAISSSLDLNLLSVSSFGFAVFETTNERKNELISLGFEINGKYFVAGGKVTPLTNDPYLHDQYAFDLMNIPEAWTVTEGSDDVLIAIIDTGIDTDHQEFVGRISPLSYNARTKVTSTTSFAHIEDDNGHGTHVAGVIGANKNNNIGIAGIVSQSMLLIIKANNADDPLTTDDESENFMDATIAEGIHYARIHGADIINLSLGTSSINALTRDAVEAAISAGIIVIGASGNDGDSDRYYPASYPGVISVGSVGATSTISSFSNFNDALDLVAPGEGIVTTGLNNGYSSVSGTSLASPQVAGVVGLLIAAYPSFSATQITDLLLNAAIDKGSLGYDIYYGYGLVDAAGALSIEYITVSFNTDGGTVIPDLSTVSGWPFDIEDPIKEGHLFLGWYKDQAFTIPFILGVDTSTINLTLYAKYEPLTYIVNFVTSGSLVEPIEVTYNQAILPPETSRTGYEFVGWFYDESYELPYQGEPIQNNITLFAQFQPIYYQISYYIGDDLYQTTFHAYQTVPELITPISEYPFIGWYLSNSFLQLYQRAPIESDLVLYARFNDGQYQVTFFDADGETILATALWLYGDQAIPPEDPVKEDSPSFSYMFSGWSEPFDYITEDLNLYPVYESIYHPETVYLNPGVDTVSSFDLWVDQGLHALDPRLRVETTITEINESSIKITYDLYEEMAIIDTRTRMVSLREQTPVTITLNPGVTTLLVGDDYQDSGATSSIGDIIVSGTVDPLKTGVYHLVYTVEIDDIIYQKTKYVYVLEEEEFHPAIILGIIPEKRWWYV